MIKLREVDKRYRDAYFIIYEMNNKNYVFNGNAEEVLEDLIKAAKEAKPNDE